MRLLGSVLLIALAAPVEAAEPTAEAARKAAALEKVIKEKLPKAATVTVTIEPSKDEPVDTVTLVVEYGQGTINGYDAVKFKAVKEVKKDAPPLTVMATQTTNGQNRDIALVRFDGGGKWAITRITELNSKKIKASSELWAEIGGVAEQTFPTEITKREK